MFPQSLFSGRIKKIKIKFNYLHFYLLFLAFISNQSVVGQDKLEIMNGDLVYGNVDKPTESVWLYKNDKGQAELKQKNSIIQSDSTEYFRERNYAEALGNVFINQDDSIDIYCHRAKYFGNARRVELIGEVALLQGVYTLQTDKLDYNLNEKVATYTTGGELYDTVANLTSIKGTYYVNDDKAIFSDSVVLITPERKIETEKLTYLLDQKWAIFEGKTTIYEEKQIIKTTNGRYNTETGEAILEGNPVIESEDTFAKAEKFLLNKETGIGEAIGNIYYHDKKSNTELYATKARQLSENELEAIGDVDITNWKDSINLTADYVKSNNEEETYYATDHVLLTALTQDTQLLSDTLNYSSLNGKGLATGRPYLTSVHEGDSIHLVAKTMQAIRKIYNQDTIYDFMANKNVILYKSDLQAIADSAYVNQKDSLITLFNRPVIWSDSTQMTADTISIFLRGKQIDRIEFRQNCFFINFVEEGLFNQLKGREMDAYFKEGILDSLHTDGNAETIFMVQDEEGGYVAIDQMRSGKMNVSFKDNKMDRIYWYNQQEGTTYPFQDANPAEFQLTGFAWRNDERPISKDELLIAIGRKEGRLKQSDSKKNEMKQDKLNNQPSQQLLDKKNSNNRLNKLENKHLKKEPK